MSKESLEHLSGLMDGELSRESGLFLTRRLSSDDQMCDTWERYHLIRDCIRQPGSKQMVSGLCSKLHESLQAEQAPAVSPWINNRWLKPVSGLAIAASVAMVAIVATAPQSIEVPGTLESANEASVQPFVSPNSSLLSPPSQAVNFAPQKQARSNRLNAYLLRHNQMAKTAGRQGFVSFVPIVSTPVASATDVSTVESGIEDSHAELETTQNR
jgi:sigma-E factor negative regulatory protein RseA